MASTRNIVQWLNWKWQCRMREHYVIAGEACPLKFEKVWLAHLNHSREKIPFCIYSGFDVCGKNIEHKPGDLIPFLKLGSWEHRRIAMYEVVASGRYQTSSFPDYAGWDDGKEFDLVFHSFRPVPANYEQWCDKLVIEDNRDRVAGVGWRKRFDEKLLITLITRGEQYLIDEWDFYREKYYRVDVHGTTFNLWDRRGQAFLEHEKSVRYYREQDSEVTWFEGEPKNPEGMLKDPRMYMLADRNGRLAYLKLSGDGREERDESLYFHRDEVVGHAFFPHAPQSSVLSRFGDSIRKEREVEKKRKEKEKKPLPKAEAS